MSARRTTSRQLWILRSRNSAGWMSWFGFFTTIDLMSLETLTTRSCQFNNAGIMHPADDNALNTEERIWDLTMQINLKGVWWGCKYAILAMRKNPTDEAKGLHVGGSIINTASFVAIMGAATPQLACTCTFTFAAYAFLLDGDCILRRKMVLDTASKVRLI